MSSAIRARVVRPHNLTTAEIDLWTFFCCQNSSLSHPFYSFAFTSAVDRVHPFVFVAILESGGRIVGFLPFQFSNRRAMILKSAERVGGDLSDRFGVIAGERLGIDATQLLAAAGLSSLSYSFMPPEQHDHGFKGQREMAGQRVLLSGDSRDFWADFRRNNKDFGSQIDYTERRCERELDSLVFTYRNAAIDRELPRIIEVKRDQYRRTNRPDGLASAWKSQLFDELLRNTVPECAAIVSTLYAGNTWLASHLGLTSRDVFHYWFPVYNVAWARLSPGHILTKHMMLAALSEGVGIFDLGGAGEYKARFRPETYQLWAGFWRAPTFSGCVSGLVQSASWRFDKWRDARATAQGLSSKSLP